MRIALRPSEDRKFDWSILNIQATVTLLGGIYNRKIKTFINNRKLLWVLCSNDKSLTKLIFARLELTPVNIENSSFISDWTVTLYSIGRRNKRRGDYL